MEEQASQVAMNHNRGKGKKPNAKTGERPASSNHKKGKSKTVDKPKIECFRCHRYGHFRSECRTFFNQDRGERSNFGEKEESEEEISLLIVMSHNFR